MEAFLDHLDEGVVTATVPNFEAELHSVEGLRRMLPHLCGPVDVD